MNANIKGLYEYAKKHFISGLIQLDNGYELSHDEAISYLKWCIDNGYEYLHDCPDFNDIKIELTLNESILFGDQLSVRAVNMLSHAGVKTNKDIIDLGKKKLSELRNCGKHTLTEIENHCESLGLDFK